MLALNYFLPWDEGEFAERRVGLQPERVEQESWIGAGP